MPDIIDRLKGCAGEGNVLTIQPGGNHGDTLIYLGMRNLLINSGVDWIPLKSSSVRVDTPANILWSNPVRIAAGIRDRMIFVNHRIKNDITTVFIHGGGNFNNHWGGGTRCLKWASKIFDCPIVIGPQSCWFVEEDPALIFSHISNPVVFYCRERYSYRIMNNIADNMDNLSVYLADDTAFHVNREDLPLNGKLSINTLLAFRGDSESVVPIIEQTVEPPFLVRDISVDETTFKGFVRVISRSKNVVTDRLHVAILAAILDKQVILYPNAYHKNKGVYEYSLKKYPNVNFVSRSEFSRSTLGPSMSSP